MRNTLTYACTLILLLVAAGGAPAEEQKEKFGDFVIHNPRKGSVVFRHKNHISSKNIPCDYCHAKIKKMKKEAEGKGDFYFMKFCITCHDGKISFQADGNCTRCHETRSAQTDRPGKHVLNGKDISDTTVNNGRYHER